MPFGNTTAGTARDFGTVLPVTLTQDVNAEGAGTPDVWYKYTAQAGDNEIGLFAFDDLVTYIPKVTVYSDAGITLYLNGIDAIDIPFQIPVTPGSTYWFKVHSNTGAVGTANLNFKLYKFTDSALVRGDMLITDDGGAFVFGNYPFPACVINGSTGAPRKFINPFPVGEAGDRVSTGEICVYDAIDTSNANVKVYQRDLSATIGAGLSGILGSSNTIRASTSGYFYIGQAGSGATFARVLRLNKDGNTALPTIGPFAATKITGAAPNVAETVLYYTGVGVTYPTAGTVKRWDITGNVGLSDLAAAVAGYFIGRPLMVLSDDTILVPYTKTAAGSPGGKVIRYDSAGVILNTYNFTNHIVGNRDLLLASAFDNPNSFWVWEKNANGISKFSNIKVSDGSVLSSFTAMQYEIGLYQGSPTLTPIADFGHSESCPFVLLDLAAPASNGTIIVTKVTDPVGAPQVFAFTTSGGLIPATFNLTDGASQSFSVTPGNGYGVAETPVTHWTTTYTVSNGSPVNNISVAAGEIVTVTVRNIFVATGLPGGIYKIVPGSGKTNDTLWVTIGPDSTIDIKIPDPSISTALIGD